MGTTIWVDADSIPVDARRMVIRFSLRRAVPAKFVANRKLPLETKNARIQMIVTEASEDAADDYIAEHAAGTDIAITRDIPLAARLVKKNVTVCGDRGRMYTKENIGEYLSIRNFSKDMAAAGIYPERIPTYGAKDLKKFADCLDREITRLSIAARGNCPRRTGLDGGALS
jgi:uncharacterized protein YaiI (UPF0178 family)